MYFLVYPVEMFTSSVSLGKSLDLESHRLVSKGNFSLLPLRFKNSYFLMQLQVTQPGDTIPKCQIRQYFRSKTVVRAMQGQVLLSLLVFVVTTEGGGTGPTDHWPTVESAEQCRKQHCADQMVGWEALVDYWMPMCFSSFHKIVCRRRARRPAAARPA